MLCFVLINSSLLWAILATQAHGMSQGCFYSIYQSFASYNFVDSSTPSFERSVFEHPGFQTLHQNHEFSRRSSSASGVDEYEQCSSITGVLSIYSSSLLYCTAAELEKGLAYWQDTCKLANSSLLDLQPVAQEVTPDFIAELDRLDPSITPAKRHANITFPMVLAPSYYAYTFRSYDTKAAAKPRAIRYGWAILGFWGGVLLLGIVRKLYRFLVSSATPIKLVDEELHGKHTTTRSSRWKSLEVAKQMLRTHIMVPAMFGSWSYHQQQYYWNTIPQRLQSLTILTFWILSIIISSVGYETFEGNILTPNVAQQTWKYVADRTGILTIACLPIVWLFGLRNNIFIWATGWSFRTFNILHRHVARVCTVLAIVHSIAYSVLYIQYQDKYSSSLKKPWFYLGIVAMISMSAMVLLSHSWVRRHFYEYFLLSHIFLGVLSIYSLFRHTSHVSGPWADYLWFAVAAWVSDRVLRLARIINCNFRIRFSRSFISTSLAKVTYDKDSIVIRIDIEISASRLTPYAGQHYYLYQPSSLSGWESHPFTLADHRYCPAADSFSALQDDESNVDVSRTMTNSDSGAASRTSLTFFVRPYDGWTRRLRDACNASQNGTASPQLLLEGPYGQRRSFAKFDSVLVIVGGTGVATAIPLVLEHVAQALHHRTRTTKLQLVWSDRSSEFMMRVCKDSLAPALQRDDFDASLFCTTPQAATSANKTADTPGFEMSKELKPFTTSPLASANVPQIQFGRPVVSSFVSAAARESTESKTTCAVVTCGPGSMADDVRAAVYSAMKAGLYNVELFEESFGW